MKLEKNRALLKSKEVENDSHPEHNLDLLCSSQYWKPMSSSLQLYLLRRIPVYPCKVEFVLTKLTSTKWKPQDGDGDGGLIFPLSE